MKGEIRPIASGNSRIHHPQKSTPHRHAATRTRPSPDLPAGLRRLGALACQPPRACVTIAVFAALPGEVDLTELVARHPDRRWVYPRVAGNELTFHAVDRPRRGTDRRRIRRPRAVPDPAPVTIDRIDAFLCPGLAFDVHGGRLGRGRGYYDRMLAGARPGALKIGVCFARQMVPDTYPEPHDVRMDVVISA